MISGGSISSGSDRAAHDVGSLNVSLKTPDSVGVADDVAKMRTQSTSPIMVPRDDVHVILDLITAIAVTRDRPDAVSVIVDRLAKHLPAATIRSGLGGKNLTRLYDRKLGWLGSESSLFAEAQARWNQDNPPSEATESNAASEQSFTVLLDSPNRQAHCVIWISGPIAKPHWLFVAAPTLQAVLWDRPARSWLRTHERIRGVSKIWIAGAVFLLATIAIWPIHYRIQCTAIVQPTQQRLVAAPFEATLLESKVRPGDAVQQGDLLVRLDGRTLRIELESIDSEIQSVEKEHDISLANGRIAEAQQAALGKRKLARRRQLLSDRLDRLDVVSPIDGVVVSGDLDRYVGSPLETGQSLVEIAPLDRVSVEIEIPEYEIGYVHKDADTRIRFASAGGSSIRQKMHSVYPSAEIRDDRSVFVAKIEVDNPDGKLRPGMRGDATTYGPLRPAIWSWVRGSWEQALWWAGY